MQGIEFDDVSRSIVIDNYLGIEFLEGVKERIICIVHDVQENYV